VVVGAGPIGIATHTQHSSLNDESQLRKDNASNKREPACHMNVQCSSLSYFNRLSL